MPQMSANGPKGCEERAQSDMSQMNGRGIVIN